MKPQADEALANMNLPDCIVASKDRVAADIKQYFQKERAQTAALTNCSCLVIKPHALENLGTIVDMVLEDGFEISALQLFNLQLG